MAKKPPKKPSKKLTIRYVKRPGYRLKGDVAVIGKHLESLAGPDGELNPEDVVEDAKSEDSPIHDEFEWDDTKAAKEYRLFQARRLTKSFEVVWIEEEVEVQTVGFVSLEVDNDASYRTSRRVLTDPEMRQQWKEQALRELRRWRNTYQHVKELQEVFDAIDGVL